MDFLASKKISANVNLLSGYFYVVKYLNFRNYLLDRVDR